MLLSIYYVLVMIYSRNTQISYGFSFIHLSIYLWQYSKNYAIYAIYVLTIRHI